jgi:rhodanese-related sulfurtransferase
MSSWNRQFAEKSWLSGLSAQFESKLETATIERPAAKNMPVLNTGLTTGAEISSARFKSLFAEGTDNILISADHVFSNPDKYYIINYERKDKYDDAHIPGAVRYKPNATLGFISEMSSIPAEETVVVYCGTGHNSGFATAYLRLLGYDARTLQYGNNGFMHDWMVKDAGSLSWLPFADSDINNFEVVK